MPCAVGQKQNKSRMCNTQARPPAHGSQVPTGPRIALLGVGLVLADADKPAASQAFHDLEYPSETATGLSSVRRSLPSRAASLILSQGNSCCLAKIEAHPTQEALPSLARSAGQWAASRWGQATVRPGEILRRILPDSSRTVGGKCPCHCHLHCPFSSVPPSLI